MTLQTLTYYADGHTEQHEIFLANPLAWRSALDDLIDDLSDDRHVLSIQPIAIVRAGETLYQF